MSTAMIEVREVPFAYPVDEPRTGIHLSDIIKDLLRNLNPKVYGKPLDEHSHGTFQRGYAWEDYLRTRSVWPARTIYQCEFIHDGIKCTLDGFDVENEKVYESKGTFYSLNNPIMSSTFIGWRWQLMGYATAAEVYRAHLDVLWLNGDYRPMRTVPKSYEWVFKPPALESNWTMIARHRDRMVKKGLLKP